MNRTAQNSDQRWISLSDHGLIAPPLRPQNTPVDLFVAGLFVIEFEVPLADGTVILNQQNNLGVPQSFAIFYHSQSGISILHRSGAQVARHALPGPLPKGNGTARLTFQFDCTMAIEPNATWELQFQILHSDAIPLKMRGIGAFPFAFENIQAICTRAHKDPAVLWFGFSSGAALPQSAPWIGMRTMVETSLGPVAAGNLHPGDIILTLDQGPMTLRQLHRFDVPACGSFAPILLRAPFYGAQTDLLVSANQQLVVTGGAVEYLFGTDAVLIAAKETVDGRTSIADERRAVVSAVALDLGGAALIDSGGVVLAVGQDHGFDGDMPLLNRFEAVTLMSMLGRAVTHAA